MTNNDFIDKFKTLLDSKVNSLNSMKQIQIELDNIERIESKIDGIIKNPQILLMVNLDAINKLLDIPNQEYEELRKYQIFIKNRLNLDNSHFDKIKVLLSKYKDKIDIKKEEYLSHNDEYIRLNLEIQFLNRIITKLQESIILDAQDIETLGELIKNNFEINEAVKLIKEYSLLLVHAYDNQDIDSEVIKITELDKDDLINLFKKYNLDFLSLNEKAQKEICLYGNLNNIKDILNVLRENEIDLTDNDIISSRSRQLSAILTLSNKEIVNEIVNNIKNDILDADNQVYELNKVFQIYLREPTLFIKGMKRYDKIKSTSNRKSQTSSENIEKEKSESTGIPGAYLNYQLNRAFLIGLGVKDINKVLDKCITLFTTSHERFKLNVNKLLSYGLTKEQFLQSSSCLKGIETLEVMDQFIEEGFSQYILDNLSMLSKLEVDSPELIQLINAKRKGFSYLGERGDKSLFRNIVTDTDTKLVRNTKILNEYAKGDKLDLESHRESYELDLDFKDCYLITNEVFDNPYIKVLEKEFKEAIYTYNFNGIIISRLKVLRCYSHILNNGMDSFDNLKYVIFKNTNLISSEYNLVLDCLNDKVKKGATI